MMISNKAVFFIMIFLGLIVTFFEPSAGAVLLLVSLFSLSIGGSMGGMTKLIGTKPAMIMTCSTGFILLLTAGMENMGPLNNILIMLVLFGSMYLMFAGMIDLIEGKGK